MSRFHRAALLILLFTGGCSALAYEVIWVRMLTLSFGVSVFAVSAVLSAFMGGLALGSWLLGRMADRVSRRAGSPGALLKLYAALEAGIGLWAILTPSVFGWLTDLYVWIHRALDPGFALFSFIRFALAMLVLLIPTTLMGGTFPVMTQVLARREQGRGGILGDLYAANTLGGVAGASLAGFLLIRLLGVQLTVYVTVIMNLAVAGLALAISTGLSPAAKKRRFEDQAPLPERPPPIPVDAHQRRFVLWAFALSGFASLGYEVVWFRLLAILSLGAVFSFTIMLITFLAGLAAGSAVTGRMTDRSANPIGTFGFLQLAIGLCGVLALFVFANLPGLIQDLIDTTTVARQMAAEFMGAALTMIAPTLLMGATFPVAARVFGAGTPAIGDRVGRLYALNTLGAMLGAVVAGQVLIRALGLQRAALSLAAINILLGCAALLMSRGPHRLVTGLGAAGAFVAALLLPPGVYLGFHENRSEQLIFYEEGVEATVAVYEGGNPSIKISFVNGRSEVPTDPISMRTFYLLGHLPPLLNPGAQSVLMVSFGNGIATGAMSRHGIPSIRAVELVKSQTEAARLYREENRNVLDYPGLEITIEDGRNYVLRSREQFDIITADSTHPINTSSWALFTREFYADVRKRLAPDGVFMQWLPFHDLALDDYRSIIGTFQSVFPHTTLWYTGGPHTFMVATPLPFRREEIPSLMSLAESRGVADDLRGGHLLTRAFLMEEEEVAGYVSGAPIVHDDTAFFVPAIDLEIILRSLAPYSRTQKEPPD